MPFCGLLVAPPLAGPSSRLRETTPFDANALPVLQDRSAYMLENQRSEQVLAALLETAGEAILGVALDGSIFLWSQGAEHFYGYTTAEVAGQSLARLLPLYEVPALKAFLTAAREGRIAACDTAERIRKDRSRVSVEVRRTALRDADGKVVGILEIGRELRKNAGNSPTETQLRHLVKHMPVVLWTTDRQLRITSNWGAGAQLFTAYNEKILGRPVSEFLSSQETNTTPMAYH